MCANCLQYLQLSQFSACLSQVESLSSTLLQLHVLSSNCPLLLTDGSHERHVNCQEKQVSSAYSATVTFLIIVWTNHFTVKLVV